MAQRRMTSLEVIDTDAFLEMPVSSQLLYFHLNARADDDGFVAGPRKIAKSIGSGADDLKVLLGKKFVIEFEDGVCVIKHWRINNFIRKDIYKETQYLDLKSALFIRANGSYTLSEGVDAVPVPNGHYKMEDVNDSLTKRQLRIGKGSIGEIGGTDVPQFGGEGERPEEKKPKDGNKYTKLYNELCDWMENLTGVKFIDRSGQRKALKLAREAGVEIGRLKSRAQELKDSGDFETKGMDWFTVVYSFNKKA